MESTRAIGYTLEAAVADIIDNSITAEASHVEIFFFPIGESYIAILDDGIGMNSAQIDTAMQYGSQSPNDKREATDLGRFGLGLKTASLSQCRTLTVVSKKGEYIETRRWDIDHVNQAEEWSLLILDEPNEIDALPQIEQLKELESGTLVIWQNLDRLKMGSTDFNKLMGRKMDDVRAHLSMVFHRYISGEAGLKKRSLKMNGKPVEPADPFLSQRNTQVMADEVLNIDGINVIIRPHILPHISLLTQQEIAALGGKDGLRRRQGFYIYRNKRLLIWGTWFRMMRQGELSKLARIQVDVPNDLDNLWTLDIKKSTAMPPEAVRVSLESVIVRMAERSKQTWTYRGKKETRDSIFHIWQRFKSQDGVYYSINREHPLVEIFSESSPAVKKNLEALLKQIEIGLPLNQLYLDFTSDMSVENEIDASAQETENALRLLLEQMPNAMTRIELLDKLSLSEPFVNFPKLIEKYRS
jgi:hypothetical protein